MPKVNKHLSVISLVVLTIGLLSGLVIVQRNQDLQEKAATLAACPALSTIQNDDLGKLGYVDVTLCGADPTGNSDSTAAIQDAINFGRDNGFVIFLPNQTNGQRGVYKISEMLRAMSRNSDHGNFRVIGIGDPNKSYYHKRDIIMQGSTNGGLRPLLRLAKSASGFSDPKNPKPLLWMWAEAARRVRPATDDPFDMDHDMSFDQSFRGIDIDISDYSPGDSFNNGAIGLMNPAAQVGVTENVTINATGAFAGIRRFGILSGGAMYNIEVIGGRYGIFVDPGWEDKFTERGGGHGIIAGSTFRDQEVAVIKVRRAAHVHFIGTHIISKKSPIVDDGLSNSGAINFIDSIIEMKDGGAIVANGKNAFFRNTYIKGAGSVTNGWSINNPSGWTRIKEYLYTSGPRKNLVNGNINTSEYKDKVENQNVTISQLISSLVDRHRIVDQPSFEDSNVVNVKEFGAAGNGIADDTSEIQTAIDYAASNNKVVFLPKGSYRTSNTLNLRPNTKMIGTSIEHTTITPLRSWKPSGETYIIQTANDADVETHVGDLKVIVVYMEPSGTDGFTGIHWRAGKNSSSRNFQSTFGSYATGVTGVSDPSSDFNYNYHRFKFSGNGGGRHFSPLARSIQGSGGNGSARSLKIDGTYQPLSIYAFDTARASRNIVMEVTNSSNVRFYFTSHESSFTFLNISDSHNIAVLGSHDNNSTKPPRPKTGVKNSNNVLIATTTYSRSDDNWQNMVTFKESYGGTTKVIVGENVALFKRGEPSFTSIGDAPPPPTPTPTSPPVSTPTPIPTSVPGTNLVINHSFESLASSWSFPGTGALLSTPQGDATDGLSSARIEVVDSSQTIQLFQKGFSLDTDASYTLSFDAKSSTGDDINVQVRRHSSPYTNYGLDQAPNLTNTWQRFTYDFTTLGLTSTTTDTRLQFKMDGFDTNGDIYKIDNVVLAKTTVSPTTPTEPIGTPVPTDTPITGGDANGDGKVDGEDFVVWLTHYDQEVPNKESDGDFDGDGRVDGADFVIWLFNFGTGV